MTDYPRKELVIAGGGHASLPLIKMGHHWKKKNLSITLASAEPYLVYSGALPQFMGGFYEWDQTAIDLHQLCERYGVKFIRGRVDSIDHQNQTITTQTGDTLKYDLLVVNVGASTRHQPADENIYPVKPMSKLLILKGKIESGEVNNILIQGGGAAGTELALNLTHPGCNHRCSITITEISSRLLSDFPVRASDITTAELEKRGVRILTGESAYTADQSAFDAVILATGNKPESVNLRHSLPAGNENRILTHASLLVKGTRNIFAAGDTADVDGSALRQIGVHAVKQGVTLRNNIEALIDGNTLESFSPYPVNPLIFSNGPDHAILTVRRFCWAGRFPAILKYMLDMHWLEKYTLPAERRRSISRLIRDGYRRAQ
jgi:NADH dehydrogenase FAD-containing subunit